MLTGHRLRILAWKAAFKGLDKAGWKKVGKGTMVASGVIFLIAVVGWILGWGA